ncbi:hypothetical protein GMOD_00001469 [Pyrenophora seminiperda CCB06]|uniref:Uncharacterized protein n=1 Tax=Pyrenophora seminiperda CCB06 TaxID=1302712 RepID=A0A3M7LZ45_9PLEO|nr:hypothetical protein GMOD_00001469 [Pyrenophora seminiperda CCB06]
MEYTPTICEPFPTVDTSAITPLHDHDAPVLDSPDLSTTYEPFSLHYESPLYTEINIPLPNVSFNNTQNATQTASSMPPSEVATDKTRPRSSTLSSLSSWRHRRSSSSSSTYAPSLSSSKESEEWPRIRKDVVKSREVNAMMDLRRQSKRGRSGTIDALAVVPAVLVLSAELFTPGTGNTKEGRRKDSGVGKWEDGIR